MNKLVLLLASQALLVACNTGDQPRSAPRACKCRVKVESTWCGPADEQRAKIEALERDPLACAGPTGTVVDLDATYVVEGCAR